MNGCLCSFSFCSLVVRSRSLCLLGMIIFVSSIISFSSPFLEIQFVGRIFFLVSSCSGLAPSHPGDARGSSMPPPPQPWRLALAEPPLSEWKPLLAPGEVQLGLCIVLASSFRGGGQDTASLPPLDPSAAQVPRRRAAGSALGPPIQLLQSLAPSTLLYTHSLFVNVYVMKIHLQYIHTKWYMCACVCVCVCAYECT